MTTSHLALQHPEFANRRLWLLVSAAWMLAIFATVTGQRALIDHHYLLEESGAPWPAAALIFLCAWQVMIVAMMLPVSMPALSRLRVRHRAGAKSSRAMPGALLTYCAVWTLFGLAAFIGDTGIHHLVDSWSWLAARPYLIGATTFALAGVFQFTRAKSACLAFCRARGGAEPTAPAWAGLRHGLASVGSCWALMLVMFGIGVGGLGWMLGLSGAMFAEARLPLRLKATQVIGVALLLLAALWLAHPTWLVPATAL